MLGGVRIGSRRRVRCGAVKEAGSRRHLCGSNAEVMPAVCGSDGLTALTAVTKIEERARRRLESGLGGYFKSAQTFPGL